MAEMFTDTLAVRGEMPTLVGLIGPSSSGKTFSALRLATGFQRVQGGDIFVIDTEAKRSLRYADRFKFRHVPFAAPFGPLRYLAAFEYCISRGAKHIIVDSMSHEHESIGGVLDMHDDEVKRLSKGDPSKFKGVDMLAWGKPKRERRLMISAFTQMSANFIFCYRAKEKIEVRKGQDPLDLGWMPLGAMEMIFEMSLNCLLYPLSNGYPTWKTNEAGEKTLVKMPEEYRDIFASNPQLSEEVGEKMAKWAASGAPASPPGADSLVARLDACRDPATLRSLQEVMKQAWDGIPKGDQRSRVARAFKDAEARVKRMEAESDAAPSSDGGDPQDDDAPPMTDDEAEDIGREDREAAR